MFSFFLTKLYHGKLIGNWVQCHETFRKHCLPSHLYASCRPLGGWEVVSGANYLAPTRHVDAAADAGAGRPPSQLSRPHDFTGEGQTEDAVQFHAAAVGELTAR